MNLSATDRRNLRTLLLMSVFEPESIGARIAKARQEAGLTQEQLAALVGIVTRTVQNHESGTTAQYRHIKLYAAVLGRPEAWFIHGDADDEEEARLAAEVARQGRLLERIAEALEVDVQDDRPDAQSQPGAAQQAGRGRRPRSGAARSD